MSTYLPNPHPILNFINQLIGYLTDVVPNSFFISERYDADRNRREKAITDALQGSNPIIADEDISNFYILTKIIDKILKSEFGVVDITGLRPNVLMELGMLYGFGKPTIVLVKADQKGDIPSNIEGIEIIRYGDFEELTDKLKRSVANLNRILQHSYRMLDLVPILENFTKSFDAVRKLRRLCDKGFSTKIVQFIEYLGQPVAVIKTGSEQISEGMSFEILVPKKINNVEVNEPVGEIVIKRIQSKIAFGPYRAYDSRHIFWENVFSNPPAMHSPSRNIVVPLIPRPMLDLSSSSLDKLFRKHKSILDLARQMRES